MYKSKANRSESFLCRSCSKKGSRNNMYGKPSTFLGKRHTEEYKARMSSDRMGEKNPYYGRLHSKETRKKNGLAQIGKKILIGILI